MTANAHRGRSRGRRGGSALPWLAIVCALGASACEPPPPAPGAPNLLVLSIDTLRPDHLGCYGGPPSISPAIDALAASGVLFEDALATAPWTLPSHASLLTGRYPSRHGADAAKRAIRDDVPRLADVLADAGWRTAAIVNSVYLRKWGVERGFADFEYLREEVSDREPSGVTARAVRWLDDRPADRPFFLFLHYYDVHSDYASRPDWEEQLVPPYDGPADGTTRQMLLHRYGRIRLDADAVAHLSRLYDAGIRQLDDQLASLVSALRERGLLERTIVVLTSDHGEEFLEHGGVLHGLSQHREVLAVPLLFAGPGVPAGVRVAEPVSLVDVVPTSLALLGVDAPPGLDGVDLSRFWRAGAAPMPPRFLYTEADFTYDPETRVKALGANRTIRAGRYRLHLDVETGATRLYDLTSDPFEQVDVADAHPDVVGALRPRLEEFVAGGAGDGEPVALDADDRALLESLGYVE